MFESSLLLSNIYAPNDITAQTAFFRNLDNILLPYANAIRSNAGIQGINVYRKEFQISLYADDTTVFVSDIRSAQNLFQLLNAFNGQCL